ncbi:MAG: TolC family protein [Parvibaculaceae bacterium]
MKNLKKFHLKDVSDTSGAATGIVTCAIISLLLSGCVVGPTFQMPRPPSDLGYILPSNDGRFSPCGEQTTPRCGKSNEASGWWNIYRSNTLNEIMDSSLAANLTLKTIRYRIQKAQEEIASNGGRGIDVDVNSSISDRNFSESPYVGNSAPSRHFFIGSDLSYTPDLFGAEHNRTQAQNYSIESVLHQLDGERLKLEEKLVVQLIDVASVQARMSLLCEIRRLDEGKKKIADALILAGRLPREDQLKYQNSLENDQEQIDEATLQYKIDLIQIATLSGRDPSHASLANLSFHEFRPDFEVPQEISSTKIFSRPDIQKALATVKQANAEVGVATANLFPTVTISANSLFILNADFSMPLFHWSALQAQLNGSELAEKEALANYRQTIVEAFGDIAANLTAIEQDKKEISFTKNLAQKSRQSLNISQRKKELGKTSSFEVLDIAREDVSIKYKLISAQERLYKNIAQIQTSIADN